MLERFFNFFSEKKEMRKCLERGLKKYFFKKNLILFLVNKNNFFPFILGFRDPLCLPQGFSFHDAAESEGKASSFQLFCSSSTSSQPI